MSRCITSSASSWAECGRVGGGLAAQLVLAVAAAVVALAIWSVWMAPRSRSRLADPSRLIAQVGLFAVVGAVLAWSGQWDWGVGFAVVAIVVFALSRRIA